MTPEEREKAVEILVKRYMSIVIFEDRAKELEYKRLEYIKTHYNLYSDEALLTLIINPKDHNVYSTTGQVKTTTV